MAQNFSQQVAEIIPLGVYRHYKGNDYYVIGVARHSESDELMVAYVRLYSREGIPMTVRPFTDFMGEVSIDGKKVRRFTFIGTAQPAPET